MFDQDFWTGPIHRPFVGSLDAPQLRALWELLLVATFADEHFSIEERREIAGALRDTPGFHGAVDLIPRNVADDLERLYVEFERDLEALLGRISEGLGDDSARRGAFRTVVQVVTADEFVATEIAFVRQLGALLGLEPEIIDFAVSSGAS